MEITQGLKRAVQTNGQKVATIDGEREFTWIQFQERVSKFAGALKKLGLSDNGRVAILSLNSDRYFTGYYAIPWAGGICVPLNIRLAPPEIIYQLNDSGTEILIVDEAFKAMLPAFKDTLETVKTIIYAGDGQSPEGTLDFENLISSHEPVADAGRGGDDVLGIFYTSGTTGRPKGAMLTHDNLISNALYFIDSFSLSDESRYLHVAPMFHLADNAATFSLTMAGGTHAFIPKFDPGDTLNALYKYKINVCTLVPVMINMMVNFPDVSKYDLSGLKTIPYGGSPMPEKVMEQATSLFPSCEFIQCFGMTELSPIATLLKSKYHVFEGPNAGKMLSVGQAAYYCEIKVVDPKGDEIPAGTVGEVLVKGPNVMKGYWNRPEETKAALKGGWMHSGDAGYLDDDGFLFISDRIKDMIISGGENIYSAEVENALYQHPAVEMCAVIGIPSKKWGETVHAIILSKQGQTVSKEDIIAFCQERLGKFKCPKSIEFSTKPLPVSGSGKILKNDLRVPFWKGHKK